MEVDGQPNKVGGKLKVTYEDIKDYTIKSAIVGKKSVTLTLLVSECELYMTNYLFDSFKFENSNVNQILSYSKRKSHQFISHRLFKI